MIATRVCSSFCGKKERDGGVFVDRPPRTRMLMSLYRLTPVRTLRKKIKLQFCVWDASASVNAAARHPEHVECLRLDSFCPKAGCMRGRRWHYYCSKYFF
jgi:hypothetical protein